MADGRFSGDRKTKEVVWVTSKPRFW